MRNYLATSYKRTKADSFAIRAWSYYQNKSPPEDQPAVIFQIQVDPRGKEDPSKLCQNVNKIVKRAKGVPDEHEYLFTPYSVFTIKCFEKSSKLKATPSHPHIIHLVAALDSKQEDDDLIVLPRLVNNDDAYLKRLQNEYDNRYDM